MITSEELLRLITKQDIVEILTELGSDTPRPDKDNLYFTTVCHHGDSRKLHYFNNGFFQCYTSCGSMSLYDLLMNANNWGFKEAFRFVADYKGVNLYKRHVGLKRKEYKNEDLEFLNRHLEVGKEKKEIVLPSYDEKVLGMFDDYVAESWIEKEGISEEVIKRFGVKFCFQRYSAIIPHYDENKRLIGIRRRSFKYEDIQAGRKYTPIVIQGLVYKYPTAFFLYGELENKEAITRHKKIVLFEGEKSVWKMEGYVRRKNNYSVALMGTNLSLWQKNKILGYEVEEIIIAFDKQYKIDILDSDDKNGSDYKEYEKYIRNLIKIAKMFQGFCSVYVVLCWDERLGYKDAPVDCGKEVFEELMREKYLVESVEELEELIK